jgi:hypothetical protein
MSLGVDQLPDPRRSPVGRDRTRGDFETARRTFGWPALPRHEREVIDESPSTGVGHSPFSVPLRIEFASGARDPRYAHRGSWPFGFSVPSKSAITVSEESCWA